MDISRRELIALPAAAVLPKLEAKTKTVPVLHLPTMPKPASPGFICLCTGWEELDTLGGDRRLFPVLEPVCIVDGFISDPGPHQTSKFRPTGRPYEYRRVRGQRGRKGDLWISWGAGRIPETLTFGQKPVTLKRPYPLVEPKIISL